MIRKNRWIFLLLLLRPLLAQEVLFQQKCIDYDGTEHVLLRSYPSSKESLLVNTQNLKTLVHSFKTIPKFFPCQQNTPYQNLKRAALKVPKSISNRGLKTGYKEACVLSVDMCPSRKKGFESDFFQTLIRIREGYPVAISITKKWALTHRIAFEQLKAWDDKKILDITWVNHGAMHPYQKGVKNEKNFINLEGVDFKKEVLENEAFLIKEGRVPSVFYRFAGLVSNEEVYECLVKGLGLIPLGSSAWLAKGESIQKRSIVLVHGNKNEPLGIRLWSQMHNRLPVIGLQEMFIREPGKALLFILWRNP